MACTVAVETVIGEHYNDQIRSLLDKGYREDELIAVSGTVVASTTTVVTTAPPSAHIACVDVLVTLCRVQLLKKNRDEELEHLDTGLANNAEQVRRPHLRGAWSCTGRVPDMAMPLTCCYPCHLATLPGADVRSAQQCH